MAFHSQEISHGDSQELRAIGLFDSHDVGDDHHRLQVHEYSRSNRCRIINFSRFPAGSESFRKTHWHITEVESQVRRIPRLRGKILPETILSALHRFDATRSIQDAAHAVSERAEMAYEQLESDLSLVRYVAWAIPSVGFIGTVRGISEALGQADMAIQGDISGVTPVWASPSIRLL